MQLDLECWKIVFQTFGNEIKETELQTWNRIGKLCVMYLFPVDGFARVSSNPASACEQSLTAETLNASFEKKKKDKSFSARKQIFLNFQLILFRITNMYPKFVDFGLLGPFYRVRC